jgi:hypothetical protein
MGSGFAWVGNMKPSKTPESIMSDFYTRIQNLKGATLVGHVELSHLHTDFGGMTATRLQTLTKVYISVFLWLE